MLLVVTDRSKSRNAYIETLHVNRCACCDDIAGVDSSERHAVDLEWTGNDCKDNQLEYA
jgi:hypothetical protein